MLCVKLIKLSKDAPSRWGLRRPESAVGVGCKLRACTVGFAPPQHDRRQGWYSAATSLIADRLALQLSESAKLAEMGLGQVIRSVFLWLESDKSATDR